MKDKIIIHVRAVPLLTVYVTSTSKFAAVWEIGDDQVLACVAQKINGNTGLVLRYIYLVN